ncbi:MAG: radical SAM protein [Syntrophales bacterium]|nr:radical SAM protein [Syntrophales bacterium]
MKRKKFALVNVPSSENAYHNFIDFVAIFPPMGLLTIANIIEKQGCEAWFFDADAKLLSLNETIAQVVVMKPDYVGCTGMTATMDIIGQFLGQVKEALPNTIVIVGGPHVSAMPRRTLEDYPAIDIGVIGEGDHTIVELISAIEGNGSLDQVKGIVFRKNSSIIETGKRPPIIDISNLLFPAWHLVDFELYRSYGWNNWVSGHRSPLGVIFTGRGCYGKCNFCASHCVFGNRMRFYPIDSIKKEIDLLVTWYGIRVLYFQDDTFTANIKLVHEICDYLIEKGYNNRLEVMVSARVDMAHAKTLKKMRQAGIRWICYGVESGNQQILDKMQKNITIEQIKKAFVLANEAGLFVAGNFMIGHLGETWETAMDTINLACKLKQDYTSFAIAIPLPGTDLYQYCIKKGIKLPVWGKFGSVNSPPIPLNDSLNAEQLIALRTMAINRFFKRPSYLLRMITRFHPIAVAMDFLKMYFALRRERHEYRF